MPDKVTALGDSVLLDYGSVLQQDLPGRQVDIEAAVARQFKTGIAVAQQLRAEGELGSVIVVDLGTNGTVTAADVASMAAALAGASLVVYVTVHVDQPWQGEVNAELRAAVRTTPHAVLANWYALAAPHPDWFYSDETHLPIGGPGAEALAHLVVEAVLTGQSD